MCLLTYKKHKYSQYVYKRLLCIDDFIRHVTISDEEANLATWLILLCVRQIINNCFSALWRLLFNPNLYNGENSSENAFSTTRIKTQRSVTDVEIAIICEYFTQNTQQNLPSSHCGKVRQPVEAKPNQCEWYMNLAHNIKITYL